MRCGLINNIKVIGDVHLGRRFVNGVPLHRRGDREAMIETQFYGELMDVNGADFVVQVGDIFDRYVVPLETIEFTNVSIHDGASKNPECDFYFLRGNHDAQRDLTKVSAFDILAELCRDLENVFFVTDEVCGLPDCGLFALVPWHPIKTAQEMVARLPAGQYSAIFGHWSSGNDDHNLLPIKELSERTKLVITGHEHKPNRYMAGDVEVIWVGSMQPLAFGEEVVPDYAESVDDLPMYLTMTLEDLETWLPEDLVNKCLRIELQPGEVLPTDIDCLQLTAKRVTEEEDEIDVQIGDFDMEKLFNEAFAKEGVSAEVTAEILAKFKEARIG